MGFQHPGYLVGCSQGRTYSLGLGIAVQGSVFRGILRWGIIDFLDRRWVRFSMSTILGPPRRSAQL